MSVFDYKQIFKTSVFLQCLVAKFRIKEYSNTNMKKQLVFAVINLGAFILGIANIQGQEVNSSSVDSNQAHTVVNISLSDIISIDEGSAASQGIVDFNYVTTTDYNSAKNVIVPNSLVITSSKTFDIKVKADAENFISGSNFIPVDVILIKALSNGDLAGNLKEITLSTADQILIDNEPFGAQKSINIDYSISANKASTVLLGTAPGTYTQKITYTATTQ